MRRCLILGGSGHLGAAMRVHARDGDVIAFSHASRPEAGSLPFTLAGSEPLPDVDVVIGAFPMARQYEGASAQDIGAAADRYLARLGGARLIQLSTDAVYSGQVGDRRESDPPDPVTDYGVAQSLLDEALLARAPDALLIRTSFIFGHAGGRLDKRLAPLASGTKRPAEQRWAHDMFKSPTEVNFLAEGIWRAIDGGLTGIVNIAGPRTSVFDFFDQALEPLGRPERPVPHSETSTDIPRDTSLNGDRMSARLGLQPGDIWPWYRRYLNIPHAG